MTLRPPVFWSAASPRERGLVALGALVVAVAIGYALWQPLQRELLATSRALAQAQSRAATAREAVDEIAGLSREARAPRTADPRAAVERVVDAQGLRGALTAVEANGGRVRLTFASVGFGALEALLDRLGSEEQFFPVEAMFAAQVAPGAVRAELTLARPPAR